ncbi:hypothetical protein SAMN05421812_11480 [Asanoa hainanensis]|uniref:Uncharacterized protein n=1 Tax=Asanoa hainanensis TaxID=560556 RepID=A0A239P721_9ACTN|nr:hypothetical protein SAMN05421812_11480 [Asanoa hainanensis]
MSLRTGSARAFTQRRRRVLRTVRVVARTDMQQHVGPGRCCGRDGRHIPTSTAGPRIPPSSAMRDLGRHGRRGRVLVRGPTSPPSTRSGRCAQPPDRTPARQPQMPIEAPSPRPKARPTSRPPNPPQRVASRSPQPDAGRDAQLPPAARRRSGRQALTRRAVVGAHSPAVGKRLLTAGREAPTAAADRELGGKPTIRSHATSPPSNQRGRGANDHKPRARSAGRRARRFPSASRVSPARRACQPSNRNGREARPPLAARQPATPIRAPNPTIPRPSRANRYGREARSPLAARSRCGRQPRSGARPQPPVTARPRPGRRTRRSQRVARTNPRTEMDAKPDRPWPRACTAADNPDPAPGPNHP